MAIVLYREKETGSDSSFDIPFYVKEDTGADLALLDAIAEATSQATSDEGSPPTHYRHRRLSKSAIRLVAQYRQLSVGNFTPPAAGDAVYTFDYRAEAQHFFHSLATVLKKHRDPAKPPDAIPNFERRINVSVKPSGGTAGVTIRPEVHERITYQFPAAVLGSAYRDTVRAAMGSVCSHPFLGNPAGTMRLVECRSVVRSDGDQTIDFGFHYKKNEEIIFGQINLGTVAGHDYAWSFKRPKRWGDGPDKLIVYEHFYGYVERLFARVSWTDALGLPAI